jgi:hypothetical protein
MITLKQLREFIEDMDDATLLGLSYDEESGTDVLAFQEPDDGGWESLLEIGELPAAE